MRIIATILLTLIATLSSAQIVGGGGYCYTTSNPNTITDLDSQSIYGCRFVVNLTDNKVYQYTPSNAVGSRWVEYVTGGGSTDTTSLSNRIDTAQANIDDHILSDGDLDSTNEIQSWEGEISSFFEDTTGSVSGVTGNNKYIQLGISGDNRKTALLGTGGIFTQESGNPNLPNLYYISNRTRIRVEEDSIIVFYYNNGFADVELSRDTVSGGSGGAVDLSNYDTQSQVDSIAAAIRADFPSGAGSITGGSYTPTITDEANASVSPSSLRYQEVGDWVDVFGKILVETDSAGMFSFNMTLPVTSFFGTDADAAGTGQSDSLDAWVYADNINFRSVMKGRAEASVTDEVFFNYSYFVIPTQQKLLATFPNANQAWSLRYVSDSVTNVARVRRSSDNAEIDVTPDYIVDSLEDWVGAGNDGFIVTWYDQSGNGNDATQSTAANQAKIVDNGSLITDPENGKPAADFDGSNDSYDFSPDNMDNRTVISVLNSQSTSTSDERTVVQEIVFNSASDNSGY